jgi:flagellar protein FlbD
MHDQTGTDARMIPLTRLNGEHVAINPDRIERADITPDVVLTMTDGSKYVIAESLDELIDRIRLFRASILALSHHLVFDEDGVDGGGHGRLRIVRGGASAGGDEHGSAVTGAPEPVSLRAVAEPAADQDGRGAQAPVSGAQDGTPRGTPPEVVPGV